MGRQVRVRGRCMGWKDCGRRPYNSHVIHPRRAATQSPCPMLTTHAPMMHMVVLPAHPNPHALPNAAPLLPPTNL